MSLSKAFRYPFQGWGWFRRILVLALVQMISMVGQMILVGYGLEIVRSLHAGQTDLPAIRRWQALRDGGFVLAAGLLYCLPMPRRGTKVDQSE